MSRGWGQFIVPVTIAALAMSGSGGTAAAATAASATPFILRQQIDAEVTAVDQEANVVRLRTDAGPFTLRGVGSAAMKGGARVVMDVAIIRHTEPAALPRSHDGTPPLVAQRVRASVAGVDRSVGVMALTSPAGRLTVELPSDTARTLRTGDRLWLDVAVRPAPDVAALPRAGDPRHEKSVKALLLMIFGRTK
jgi:hypothetical protein